MTRTSERVINLDPDRWQSRADGPRWLYAEPGRLRAAWRLCVFGLAMLVAQPVCESVLAPLFAAISVGVGDQIEAYPWITCATTLVALTLALRFVDRQPWSSVGLAPSAWRRSALIGGFGIGAGAIGATVALLALSGAAHIVPVHSLVADPLGGTDAQWSNASWAGTTTRLTLLLAPAALWEELVFRGYFWSVARDAGGVHVARWSTAFAFGAVHLMNPGASVQSTTLVLVAGAALGTIRERTDSLSAAWLAHFAWNWVMAALLHMPVSGVPFETPGYRVTVSGADWWTGGAWGPEGGVAALVVMVVGIALASRSDSWWHNIRTSSAETPSS